jgi:hypothetical protein
MVSLHRIWQGRRESSEGSARKLRSVRNKNEIEMLPWKRSYELAKSGHFDGSFCWKKTLDDA